MVRLSTATILAAGALTAFLATTTAYAVTDAEKAALRANCRSDFIAHCKGVSPGGVDAFKCLDKNYDSLAPACQTAVKAVDPKAK